MSRTGVRAGIVGPFRTMLWMMVAFAAFTIILNQLFERVFHFSLYDSLRSFTAQPGIPAMAVVIGLLSADIFLPVPSSIVMVLSGVLFGSFRGGLISLTGSLLGNILGYEAMRRLGPVFCARFVSESDLASARPLFDKYGAAAIILSRPLPVLMETISLVAGLVGMPRSRFLLASAVGTLPICFLYAYAGSESMATRSMVPALALLVLVPAAGWIAVQRIRRSDHR